MKNDLRDSKIPFPEEINHLCEITQKLEEALQDAKADVSRIDREYRDAKRYMAECRGEIDPNEMFQNELLLKQTDETGGFAVSIQDKISKLKESPILPGLIFRDRAMKNPKSTISGGLLFVMTTNC